MLDGVVYLCWTALFTCAGRRCLPVLDGVVYLCLVQRHQRVRGEREGETEIGHRGDVVLTPRVQLQHRKCFDMCYISVYSLANIPSQAKALVPQLPIWCK